MEREQIDAMREGEGKKCARAAWFIRGFREIGFEKKFPACFTCSLDTFHVIGHLISSSGFLKLKSQTFFSVWLQERFTCNFVGIGFRFGREVFRFSNFFYFYLTLRFDLSINSMHFKEIFFKIQISNFESWFFLQPNFH